MRTPTLLALAAVCSLLAACGASKTPAAKAPAISADTAKVRFAHCMRKAGIDFPDPGTPGKASVSIPDSISPQRADEIQSRCEQQSGLAKAEPPPTTAAVQEAKDGAVKYTHCMRDRGIDIPDPIVASRGVAIRMGTVNASSPRFKSAQTTCGKLISRGP